MDICCNHHCGALAICLAHPDRAGYKGSKILTINSLHDKRIKTFSMWQHLNSFSHFDAKNYDHVGLRTANHLEQVCLMNIH